MSDNNNLDIVALIQNNPISRLNPLYNQKFLERVGNSFTDEEQQLFLGSFYTYLNYDKENDFVIELNKVWKWLGFSRKDPCKVVLEKHFTKDIDYKIVLSKLNGENFAPEVDGAKINNENIETRGGHNKETILLNVKTFKKLCLKSNTKRADSIHDYFIRLEEVLQEILLEESQDLQQELENQKKELATLKRLKAKKWHDQEPGDTIYAIKVDDMIKLGKTRNIKKREAYYTENQTGDMFYIKRCYNCDLAEKVIHHILDKHREENNKEWFNISNELAIYVIDIVCNFLDSFINASENLPLSNLREWINLASQNANTSITSTSARGAGRTEGTVVSSEPSMLNKVVKIECNEDKYKRFIDEFCELGDEYSVLSYELFGAYRIWAKGATNTDRSQFAKFIKKHYTSKRKYYKEHDSSLLTYFGIKPRDLVLKGDQDTDNLPKYEEFILTECKYNYNYRMGYTTFMDSYKEWCYKKYGDFTWSKKDQFNLDTYINRHFLKEKINMPGFRNVMGIWGFQLKSENSIKVGQIPVRRKEIVKIDHVTRTIIEEYSGINMAAKILKMDENTIRKYIRNKQILTGNFILEFKNDLSVVEDL